MNSSLISGKSSFDELLVNDTPLIDVRAPVEFLKGALPAASNQPILDDDERHAVGLNYKENGPEAAQTLGYELVSGANKAAKVSRWAQFCDRHPNALLYCFRGGMRSGIACDWLSAEGFTVPRIEGGYKALRSHLLQVFENLPALVIIGGKTGTGKTEFLESFSQAIDLEGIANHRGSAFGRRIDEQPTQANFENLLAVTFLKQQHHDRILLEDEGRLIGRIHLPIPLQDKMKQSPLVMIEEDIQTRTERIYQEYIQQQWDEYLSYYADSAAATFEDYLLGAVDAIRKRLGGLTHMAIRQQIKDACEEHRRRGELALHRRWISTLLTDYYDPMYNYQMEKKASRIRFRGKRLEATQWYADNEFSL